MALFRSAARRRIVYVALAGSLLIGPRPTLAQEEGSVVRLAMPPAEGPRKARKAMARRIRKALRQLGVKVVSASKFVRTRRAVKRRRGRRLSRPGLDRATARATGASYLLRLDVSRRSEIQENRRGIFTRTRYGSVVRLVDASPRTKKSALKVRVVYYTPREAKARARSIASEVVAKIREIESRGGRALARFEPPERERRERRERRGEAREHSRRKRRRGRAASRREGREFEDAFEREEGRRGGEAVALIDGESEGRGSRFRRERSSAFEREGEGEVEGEVATTLEFDSRRSPVELDAQLSTFVGGETATSVVISPRIPLSEGLALYAKAQLYRAWSDENAGSLEDGLNDIELGLEFEDLFKLGSFTGVLSTGVQFPTSPQARDVDNVLTWLATTELEGPEGLFVPTFELSFRKFFPTIDPAEVPVVEPEPFFCATIIRTACPFLGEFPPNFLIAADLIFELTDPWVEAFTAQVRVGYELVDAGVVEQTSEGIISLTYAPSALWNVSLGTLTFAPFKNAAGSIRFPFFDLESEDGLNYTVFFARLSYTPGAEEESEARE